MEVVINNMLGVHQAKLALTPGKITVVSGPNASGKTSIATAVGAVLAHDDNPLTASSAQRKAYMRDDTDAGEVTLVDDNGDAVVRWYLASSEMARLAQAGEPMSAAAVGLVDFIRGVTSAKARVELWEGYFLPPAETLIEQIKTQLAAKIDERQIAGVVETIGNAGWDAVEGVYKERARLAKQSWTKITGEKWGEKKAADWRPDEWLSEYDGVSIEDAEGEFNDAQADLQGRYIENAISAADVENAAEAAEELPEKRKRLEAADATFQAAKKAHDAFKEGLDQKRARGRELRNETNAVGAKRPKDRDALACPECGAQVILLKGALVGYDTAAAEAALAAWQEEFDAAEAALVEFTTEFVAEEKNLEPLARAMADAAQARQTAQVEVVTLEQTMARADQGTVETEETQQAVAEGEAAVERKRTKLTKIRERFEAYGQHKSIVEYTLIADILGPKGVRAQAMKQSMDLLDAVLEPIHKIAAWPRVRVDSSYAISIDGRTLLRVCAKSEQLRAQYSLQIGVARVRRDPVIVLDEADILDQRERMRLRKLLETMLSRDEPPAVLVCGTDFDVDEWPDAHRYVLDGMGSLNRVETLPDTGSA